MLLFRKRQQTAHVLTERQVALLEEHLREIQRLEKQCRFAQVTATRTPTADNTWWFQSLAREARELERQFEDILRGALAMKAPDFGLGDEE